MLFTSRNQLAETRLCQHDIKAFELYWRLDHSEAAKGEAGLKEWRCVQVKHHEGVGKTIEEWEKAGWRLYTYQTAGMGGTIDYTVNHYLLFVKGE
jgi:tRNA(Leu) C34 or U34 (ribose-2'-O)-methylase TrmL